MITDQERTVLYQEAIQALTYSYAPYSNYNVGAALLTKEGRIYRGCNIENAAYGPTNCAERTAFFKAVSEGERDFQAIVILGGKDAAKKVLAGEQNPLVAFAAPCGVCRQVMAEFCNPEDFEIILMIDSERYQSYLLKELLPESFGPGNLNERQ